MYLLREKQNHCVKEAKKKLQTKKKQHNTIPIDIFEIVALDCPTIFENIHRNISLDTPMLTM